MHTFRPSSVDPFFKKCLVVIVGPDDHSGCPVIIKPGSRGIYQAFFYGLRRGFFCAMYVARSPFTAEVLFRKKAGGMVRDRLFTSSTDKAAYNVDRSIPQKSKIVRERLRTDFFLCL